MSRKNKTKATLPDSIPAEFLARIASIVDPKNQSQVLDSFSCQKKTAFRVNTLLGDRANALAILTDEGILVKQIAQLPESENGSFFEDAFWVEPEQRDALIASKAFDQSLIYVQNPSSMLATLVLDPQPGEVVLDLAAAPGGKTLHIAAKMRNEGQLSAVEPIRGRFFKLQANLKRYGAEITRTYMTDGRTVGKKTPERFDRVLLDAPCSGESRIHQDDPASWQHWKPRKIKEQARKQYGLIRSAFAALKPGGTLLYCTCSFAPEENEAVVSDFLTDTPEANLVQISLPILNQQNGLTSWQEKEFGAQANQTIRVLPNDLFDGFFLAKFEKVT